MPFHAKPQKYIPLAIVLILMIALVACNLQSAPNQIVEDPTPLPVEPTHTLEIPAAEPPTVSYESISFSFGPEIAQSWKVEFVPEGPGSTTSAGPVEHTDPAHLIFVLDNYAVPPPSPNSRNLPMIYIYPAPQMAEQNPVAAPRIAGLQAFLETPPANLLDQSEQIPFLPLFNASQAIHTQVKFLDFQNGRGVRFLTMYSQGPMPIANGGIFYTFQGLTDDGQYYVAALMPVNHPLLRSNANEANDLDGDAFMTDPINYINGVAEQLDRQAASTFIPDLSALDAMIETLLVHP